MPMNNLVDYQYIDPELLLDKYHPVNQPFYQHQLSIQRAIVHQTAQCKPKHVEVAKLHINSMSNGDIAAQMQYAPASIPSVLRRKEVQHLIELLRFYSLHLEGPSIEHRKRMLNEIAVDNQGVDDAISIRAVHEMNSMDGVGKDKQDRAINITINNQQLPKGALDV